MLCLQLLDQSDELAALLRVLQTIVVIAQDRIRIGFVCVFKGLGNEIRADDLLPERVAKNVGAAIGERLVHDVPDFNFSLVTTDHGEYVIVHPLQQLIASRTRSAKTTAKSATTGQICPGRVRGGGGPI